jgi:hypothetical protein
VAVELISLTYKGTGDKVLVNLSNVSTIWPDGQGSVILFLNEAGPGKLQVTESQKQILELLEASRAPRS